ncbi:short transient receptor potential channel 4-like isoform X1 [Oculina patagonica]
MAQEVSPTDLDLQTSDTFDRFLEIIQEGTKDEVEIFLSRLTGTAKEASKCSADFRNEPSKQLADAIEDNDVVEVWKLIANANENENGETLENLSEVCRTIAENENNKEDGRNFKWSWDCKELWKKLKSSIYWIFQCDEDDIEDESEMRIEKEQKWVKILSNPLYISLEWLWRNNPKSEYKKGIRRKESKFADVIEAALDDAYLLEKIASYDKHYSQDEYTHRAMEYEKFAADIVEQIDNSDLSQLHEIMDIKGNGSLLKEKPGNFNQSLSLLKMAADKKRKWFVASPKCQFALNEVVYRGWRNWHYKGIVRKTLRFVFHFLLVALTCLVYIPVRLMRTCCYCHKYQNKRCWKFRMLYEYPYSKFINHTMSYVVFLCLVFASSYTEKFGTTATGLVWIDYPVLVFVCGLFLQGALEITRRGFLNYFSKWWNVVDTLIVLTFLLSYIVWLSAWGIYGEWKPRKDAFIVSNTIYASATVMAFFHLAHILQVNSVLGPLQLSLYKMLKDVLKFLAIFLLLYIAFATGVVKIYSYYVASQIRLKELDDSHDYNASHPFGRHIDVFNEMFWLLVGGVEEENIPVEDPAFVLTSTFGRIFMVAHVICTVMVAINMLIAMMNNSFNKIMENAIVEWQFSRTQMWLEWIDEGNTIPVPFNIVYYFLYCFRPNFCKTCCCKEQSQNDPQQSTSLVQGREDQGRLHVQEENHEEPNWITRHFASCCTCICSGGTCRCTFGCICCKAEKYSMRERRLQEMKTLVVKNLKRRYSARWKEITSP